MYLLLATILLSLEAIFEGFKYDGKHKISGSIEFVLLAINVFLSFAWITGAIKPPLSWAMDYPSDFWKILMGYLFYRFGYFDPLLNIIRRKKTLFFLCIRNSRHSFYVDKIYFYFFQFIYIK